MLSCQVLTFDDVEESNNCTGIIPHRREHPSISSCVSIHSCFRRVIPRRPYRSLETRDSSATKRVRYSTTNNQRCNTPRAIDQRHAHANLPVFVIRYVPYLIRRRNTLLKMKTGCHRRPLLLLSTPSSTPPQPPGVNRTPNVLLLHFNERPQTSRRSPATRISKRRTHLRVPEETHLRSRQANYGGAAAAECTEREREEGRQGSNG